MTARNRLTTSAYDALVAHLPSGDHVFVIPYFQRPYWRKLDKLKQLTNELLRVSTGPWMNGGRPHFSDFHPAKAGPKGMDRSKRSYKIDS